jgi:KUP system potassium uptake protein
VTIWAAGITSNFNDPNFSFNSANFGPKRCSQQIMNTPTKLGRIAAPSALAALGVVYGDIGTSPLYALRACFSGDYGVAPSFENVTGILSLVFWAITWIVVIKYLTVLMRASNNGEGGIMALIALLTPRHKSDEVRPRYQTLIILLGLFGAALLYGDGMITPAVSVLSAVEGLGVATPLFNPVIVPITVGILIALFMVQKRGTEKVGAIFGPAMLLWFLSIAAIALPWLFKHPAVLMGLNPWMGLKFLMHNGVKGVLVLTAVVLCITGAEALYADMGHFGPNPIRKAWYLVVYPSLILNYFGQGALLLDQGQAAIANPFFSMTPQILLYPMVLLATVATVIASQALISGAFSMTQQAIFLGFLPRLRVLHTSESTEGQIYIPTVNKFLLLSCVALVLSFQSSDKLTGAYGIAVTGTMLITSLLFYQVSKLRWKWPAWASLGLTGLFVVVDFTMLVPNLTKVVHGGWVPIVAAIFIFILMTTWARGQEIILRRNRAHSMLTPEFLAKMDQEKPERVRGTSVFVTRDSGLVPAHFLHNYKHNKIVHEKVILLVIVIDHVPTTSNESHGVVKDLGHGFYEVFSTFGFMQRPDLSEIIKTCEVKGIQLVPKDVSFYLSHDLLRGRGTSRMARWRKQLYIFISANAQPIMEFLGVNPEWVIEIGALVDF